MLNLIGMGMALNGNTLNIALLGNCDSIGVSGYNPCLEVEFDNPTDIEPWFCQRIAIELDDTQLMDSENAGFKRISYTNCKMSVLSEEEMTSKIQEHLGQYNIKILSEEERDNMKREELKESQERISRASKVDKEISKIQLQIDSLPRVKGVQLNFDASHISNSWQTNSEDNKELVAGVVELIQKHLEIKLKKLEDELESI